jgi:hypothetical protein
VLIRTVRGVAPSVIRFCRPSIPGNLSPPRTWFGLSQPTDSDTLCNGICCIRENH